MNKKVCWFDISMNNIILMNHLKPIAYLHQNILNFSLR